MVSSTTIKSCCGGSSQIISSASPVLSQHIPLFESAGFFINKQYSQSGLFYAKLGNLVAVTSFGICKINVKCSGNDCAKLLLAFENVLTQIENLP